jgi:hypothetical protein
VKTKKTFRFPTHFTLEVTEKHLAKAIAAEKKGVRKTEGCLMAQAFKEKFPTRKVSVGYTTATIGAWRNHRSYSFDPIVGYDLVVNFDKDRSKLKLPAKVKAMLMKKNITLSSG